MFHDLYTNSMLEIRGLPHQEVVKWLTAGLLPRDEIEYAIKNYVEYFT